MDHLPEFFEWPQPFRWKDVETCSAFLSSPLMLYKLKERHGMQLEVSALTKAEKKALEHEKKRLEEELESKQAELTAAQGKLVRSPLLEDFTHSSRTYHLPLDGPYLNFLDCVLGVIHLPIGDSLGRHCRLQGWLSSCKGVFPFGDVCPYVWAPHLKSVDVAQSPLKVSVLTKCVNCQHLNAYQVRGFSRFQWLPSE
jgi:hypothetical protein